jgi:hypothetical protein
MAERGYTDADVETVARATAAHRVEIYYSPTHARWGYECSCGRDSQPMFHDGDPADRSGNLHLADAILGALDDAGRLIPDGATPVVEYGVRVDEPHPGRSEKAGHVITHFGAEKSRLAPKFWRGWTTVTRRKTSHTTPWEVAE